MKEIVVISGKGGTGKTSITASLAVLGGNEVIIADCDVDAADMHLLMKPDFGKAIDFYSGELACIDPEICINCEKCRDVCRFDAISIKASKCIVDPLGCEGCGYCALVCPVQAITNTKQNVGKWFLSEIRTGTAMVHARLNIGAENSGKLVAKVKNRANQIARDNNVKYVVVDASPGIGCPVISSLSGADYVVIVTEPTVSGLHDLKRVYTLVKKFHIKAGCIINKSDINKQVANKILDFLNQDNILHISSLPYDESFTDAMISGKTIVEFDKTNIKTIVTESWNKILQTIK